MQILHSEIEADVSYKLAAFKPLWRISENWVSLQDSHFSGEGVLVILGSLSVKALGMSQWHWDIHLQVQRSC